MSAARKMARARIVRVVPVLDFGGVESLLAIQARANDREHFDLSVCTFWRSGRAARQVEACGIAVTELGVDPRVRNISATWSLARHLRRLKPALAHSSVPEADFHTAIACRLLGIPCIIDEAGMPARSALGRAAYTVLHRSVAQISTVSSELAEYLATHEHAPRRKIRVVPTCADWASFENPKSTFESAPDGFRLVAVGRLNPVKNHECLVAAVRLLARDGLRVQVDIAGDGPSRAALVELARREGVEDRVRFLGFHDDRAGLLRAADAYVLPSWSEGCSLSLIEAMASGVPVMASRVPGNLEVLGEGLAQWTAPPDSPHDWAALIRRMAEATPEERRGLSQAARELARARFSPSSYVRATETMYEEVLRQVGRGGVGRTPSSQGSSETK
jgi:glycosyltransferase involved in cell wall biosynthesis